MLSSEWLPRASTRPLVYKVRSAPCTAPVAPQRGGLERSLPLGRGALLPSRACPAKPGRRPLKTTASLIPGVFPLTRQVTRCVARRMNVEQDAPRDHARMHNPLPTSCATATQETSVDCWVPSLPVHHRDARRVRAIRSPPATHSACPCRVWTARIAPAHSSHPPCGRPPATLQASPALRAQCASVPATPWRTNFACLRTWTSGWCRSSRRGSSSSLSMGA